MAAAAAQLRRRAAILGAGPLLHLPHRAIVTRRWMTSCATDGRWMLSSDCDDAPTGRFVALAPSRVQHSDHTLQRELIKARNPRQLLDIWEREHEEAGWFTCIALLDRMAAHVRSNKPLHDRDDQRLDGVLQSLYHSLDKGGMTGFSRLVHHTADLTTLRNAMVTLRLEDHCEPLFADLLEKIEQELDEDDDDTGELCLIPVMPSSFAVQCSCVSFSILTCNLTRCWNPHRVCIRLANNPHTASISPNSS